MGMTFKEIEIPSNIIDEARALRGELLEAVAEFDDNLLEKYFEDENSLTEREILDALREATIAGKVVPMMCGSAFKNKGVQAVLDAVIEYLPSPTEVKAIEGTLDDGETVVERPADDTAPFSALAFKIATDPFVGKLTFVRVYCGILTAGTYVYNASKNEKERIGKLVRMHANKQEIVDEIQLPLSKQQKFRCLAVIKRNFNASQVRQLITGTVFFKIMIISF